MLFPAQFDSIYSIGAAGYWLRRWTRVQSTPRRFQIEETREIEAYVIERERVAEGEIVG